MEFVSTRDDAQKAGAAEAILRGIAPDGGLYIPTSFPRVDFAALRGKSYAQTAFAVLRGFLPEYDEAFLRGAIRESYEENFAGKAGHLERLADGLYSLEMWHGPTSAFKDYALQLVPKLLGEARRMRGESGETIILVATSGDTGSAALNGYRDCPGVKIAVFYPDEGTSEVQRLQMVTQEGANVAVYAVVGNFDDAQRGVKKAFVDAELAGQLAARGAKLSSANSINLGRLIPQIVYYVTSYLRLCDDGAITYGDALDFCVPTGNFGDILAGYYAKKMGLPVGRLICASNTNNVLSDFLQSGVYDTKRAFYKTSSPSMDVLVSSNLERLLRHESGSAAKVREWMADLAEKGSYQVDAATLAGIRSTFSCGWAGEEQVEKEIRGMFENHHYLCDPHTAVAFGVLREQEQSGRPTVVLSTASPFKFSGKVLAALGQAVPSDEFAAMAALSSFSGQTVPPALAGLEEKQVRFTACIAADEISRVPLSL